MGKFGERFKELRMEKGLSQDKISKLLGVSQGAVAKWELNKTEPTESAICAVAKFFNISAEYLLGLDSAEYRTLSTPKDDLEMKVLEWFRALPSDAARREFVEQLPMHTSTEKRKKA